MPPHSNRISGIGEARENYGAGRPSEWFYKRNAFRMHLGPLLNSTHADNTSGMYLAYFFKISIMENIP
jgi:hypothetical protein